MTTSQSSGEIGARDGGDAAGWRSVVPALWLVLFAGWCGNLLGGVTAAGSTTAAALLLGGLLALGGHWRDPLRLGRLLGLLPYALLAVAAASRWLSPVPRAGRDGLVWLALFLWLPATVERCLARPGDRRVATRAIAAVVGAIALWSLLEPLIWGAFRFSTGTLAPLGHHTLLAAWLVTLLPLSVLPLREDGRWRLLGAAAGLLAIVAVLASRSLLGGLALAVEAGMAALWLRRTAGSRGRVSTPPLAPATVRPAGWRRWWTVPALTVLLAGAAVATLAPRVLRIAAGEDRSVLARAVYYRAGWHGFLARPLLGWGPGSAAWTAAAFRTPRPGISPWGEAVGELHSLPIQIAYELGTAGLLAALALGGAFARCRLAEIGGLPERPQRAGGAAADAPLVLAGLLGLAGAALALLGTAAVAVVALPLALAVAAGAALAGGRAAAAPISTQRLVGPFRRGGWAKGPWAPHSSRGGANRPDATAHEGSRLPVRVAAVAVALLLAPAAVARWHYDRAVASAEAGRREDALAELREAVAGDARFPLYRMQLGLLGGESPSDRAAAARLALEAARDGGAIPALWRVAGLLGRKAASPWAASALESACWLDPFDPYSPFYLAVVEPDAARAPRLAAQALVAEPRLAAAIFWELHPRLYARALDELRRLRGVDPGWLAAFLRAAPPAAAASPRLGGGRIEALELDLDFVSFTESLSVHVFRRRPSPILWRLIELRREPLPGLSALPPAWALPSSPALFGGVCGDRRTAPDLTSGGLLLRR